MRPRIGIRVLMGLLLHGVCQQSIGLDYFDPNDCAIDDVRITVVEGTQHYDMEGSCGSGIPISLDAHYSSKFHRYREVISHVAIGASMLEGLACSGPLVFVESYCVSMALDPTGSLHRRYGPLARKILSAEQRRELKAQLARISLSAQSRQRAMKIPREIETDERAAEALDFDSASPGAMGAAFSVSSPEDQKTYTVAPLFKLTVPERVDIQYNVNVCPLPMGSGPCEEQWSKFVRVEQLTCTAEENLCRYEGAIGIPMKANRHYQMIIRPHSRPNYKPIVLSFDFVVEKNPLPMKRRLNPSQD